MSTDLVTIDNDLVGGGDRQRALAQLAHDAEHAATPEEAQELMLKGRTIANLLVQAKAPFEEARLAGKASVLAGKRLGTLLCEVSRDPQPPTKRREGWGRSPRRQLMDSLGVLPVTAAKFIRLAQVDNAEFQRYLQRSDIVPSIQGALIACKVMNKPTNHGLSWRKTKRARAGVKTPSNPSLDACYSQIVKALGHATACNAHGAVRQRREIAEVIAHLYAAEDLLKKYRGGYV